MNIWFLTSGLIFVLIVILAWRREGERRERRKDAFEKFENIASNGSISFKTFDDAEAWRIRGESLTRGHPLVPLLWVALVLCLLFGYFGPSSGAQHSVQHQETTHKTKK